MCRGVLSARGRVRFTTTGTQTVGCATHTPFATMLSLLSTHAEVPHATRCCLCVAWRRESQSPAGSKILSIYDTHQVLEAYCSWLENRVVSRFDTATAEGNYPQQAQVVAIMTELDKEKSIAKVWAAAHLLLSHMYWLWHWDCRTCVDTMCPANDALPRMLTFLDLSQWAGIP